MWVLLELLLDGDVLFPDLLLDGGALLLDLLLDLPSRLSFSAGVFLAAKGSLVRVLLDLLLDGDVLLRDVLDVDAGASGSPSRWPRAASRGRLTPCFCPHLFAWLPLRAAQKLMEVPLWHPWALVRTRALGRAG